MADRSGQPSLEQSDRGRGGPKQTPSRSTVTGLLLLLEGMARFGQSIERSIDQRATDGENPTEIGVGLKLFGQGKTVGRFLGQQSQDDPFVQ